MMILALPAFVGAHLLLAVAEQVPTIDVLPSCRAGASSGLALSQDVDSCVRSENAARDELAKHWSEFPQADRTSCLQLTTTGSSGTYTDFLTCLEIKRDARKIPKEPGLGAVGQSPR
jgi:hypothetical protein